MKSKKLKGTVEISYGMDDFAYIKAKNGRRVNLNEWFKYFDGKEIEIRVLIKKHPKGIFAYYLGE